MTGRDAVMLNDMAGPHETFGPTLSVEGYEGSIDGLLELARAQRIDWTKLSILALIEAFVALLERALEGGRQERGREERPVADLACWGDWLVMAATLALLRSRLLLPPDSPQARAAEDEAEALRERLIRRAEVEAAARWLGWQPQLGHSVFGRGASERMPVGRVGDLAELFQACLAAIRMPEQEEAGQPLRFRPLWRVIDALAMIQRSIGVRAERFGLDEVLPRVARTADYEVQCRAALATTFAAGLELARDGVLTLEQSAAFEPIVLQPLGRVG